MFASFVGQLHRVEAADWQRFTAPAPGILQQAVPWRTVQCVHGTPLATPDGYTL